jgi:hypothetical protein
MKRFLSLAMVILLAGLMLTLGAVPAAADANDCPNDPDGEHDYFPFMDTGSRTDYRPGQPGYYICANGCGHIVRWFPGSNIGNSYSAGQTITTIYLSYRQVTNLPTPSTLILQDHNFRYEVTKGEQYIEMAGRNVVSKKSFTKISSNQVQAICDFGTATFDIKVRPELPFGWFIIIFGFGWSWW